MIIAKLFIIILKIFLFCAIDIILKCSQIDISKSNVIINKINKWPYM